MNMKVTGCRIIDLPKIVDGRGNLSIIEQHKQKTTDLLDYCDNLNDICDNMQLEMSKAKAEDEITIGINPFTSPADIKNMYAPILERIFKSIGMKTRIVISKDYNSEVLMRTTISLS